MENGRLCGGVKDRADDSPYFDWLSLSTSGLKSLRCRRPYDLKTKDSNITLSKYGRV